MLTQIKYAKLNPNAKPPMRKNPTDAGIDFYSCETVSISAHSFKVVKTGVTVEIPEGYMLLIKPKGKNNHLVGAGVGDAYYQPGEIMVRIANILEKAIYINEGDAIAQGIYIPIETPELVETTVDELSNDSLRSKTGGILNQL